MCAEFVSSSVYEFKVRNASDECVFFFFFHWQQCTGNAETVAIETRISRVGTVEKKLNYNNDVENVIIFFSKSYNGAIDLFSRYMTFVSRKFPNEWNTHISCFTKTTPSHVLCDIFAEGFHGNNRIRHRCTSFMELKKKKKSTFIRNRYTLCECYIFVIIE